MPFGIKLKALVMLGKCFAIELFINLSSKAILNFIPIYSYFMTTKIYVILLVIFMSILFPLKSFILFINL